MKKPVTVLICLGLIIAAVVIFTGLIATAPKAAKSNPPKVVPLVEAVPLHSTTEKMVLEAAGTVLPAEEVLLRARISSEVIELHPECIEGGLIRKGEVILTLDPQDYELALAQAESSLDQARLSLALEQGQQGIARREWELLGAAKTATEAEKKLALRIPHLRSSETALKSAEAAYKKAEINLERTRIFSPFNAVVMTRNVNIGSQASMQDVLTRLAGTDSFWIKASVPVDRLPMLQIPGGEITAVSVSGAKHQGKMIRRMAQLSTTGRMAQVLIEVDDPLCLTPEKKGMRPLLLGEYVRLALQGAELKQVFRIPREALHENETVWIADEENRLSIRTVNIRWRDTETLLVDGAILEGERLITSMLTAPIQGIDLDVAEPSETENRN